MSNFLYQRFWHDPLSRGCRGGLLDLADLPSRHNDPPHRRQVHDEGVTSRPTLIGVPVVCDQGRGGDADQDGRDLSSVPEDEIANEAVVAERLELVDETGEVIDLDGYRQVIHDPDSLPLGGSGPPLASAPAKSGPTRP